MFHLTFMPVTDNYPIYMVLGALYFLVLTRPRPWFWLGLLAGLMTLARSDGLIWLALTFLLVVLRVFRDEGSSTQDHARLNSLLIASLRFASYALLGFLLIMGPWYLRNLQVYGGPMAPGGSRVLWLTRYDETFIFPPSKLTFDLWLASGWAAILRVRLWALGTNLQSMIAAQGHLVLFPFILAGMWVHRTDRRVQIGVLGWVGLLVIMTALFPFAGVRGSFFHAGAALQPLFWSLAPIGLEFLVAAVAQPSGLARSPATACLPLCDGADGAPAVGLPGLVSHR